MLFNMFVVVAVFLLTYLANAKKRNRRINLEEQFIMVYKIILYHLPGFREQLIQSHV